LAVNALKTVGFLSKPVNYDKICEVIQNEELFLI